MPVPEMKYDAEHKEPGKYEPEYVASPKKKMVTPNTRYFDNLNQIGCDLFEKATSISRLTSLLKVIGFFV
jgi:hypothetical protein